MVKACTWWGEQSNPSVIANPVDQENPVNDDGIALGEPIMDLNYDNGVQLEGLDNSNDAANIDEQDNTSDMQVGIFGDHNENIILGLPVQAMEEDQSLGELYLSNDLLQDINQTGLLENGQSSQQINLNL
jgi:hypothetical protein